MPFNCFSAGGGNRVHHELAEVPRPACYSKASRGGTKKGRLLRRHGSADSRSSAVSNDSISKLPPCKRSSDPKIEAMMMSLPAEERPSRCLRLSQPKTYGDIIYSMKACKGCRDWRNFDVFYADDVDMNVSAVERARRRALDFERKLRELNSFSSSADSSDNSDSVDMIG